MSRSLSTVVVANRGEIARRIMRTCRAMGLRSVGLYSDPDRRSPHVREADEAFRLPGATPADTYLDVGKVIDVAHRSGADAVHPGYGFVSENADAAQACIDAGLVWVGPSPAAIRAMASKVESKRLVGGVGVPLLPSATIEGDHVDEWRRAAATVGYPLLVKASAGGGGKGMRRVDGPDTLA
ncbi:MAG TPA: biotin carboxylase N-terminal domain-containing protein, partial [Acidimicrobiales bacterium]